MEGFNGQKDLHESYLVIEPNMGVPTEQCARIQVNLAVSKKLTSVYSQDIQALKGMILPLFWLELVSFLKITLFNELCIKF